MCKAIPLPKCTFWAVLGITGVVVLFFLPLFWPKLQLLVTPDFGKSDAWHFGFASKYLLWESLHQGRLPLWTDKIGAGFPMLAEAEIGTFFLPNLLFYGTISDPALAHNITLVFTIITLATGIYVWLRSLSLSIASSLFGSLTFTLSGTVILQLPHIALLQAFSLMGWIMAWTAKLETYKNRRYLALGAFVVSQQLLAGSPQVPFITLLLAVSFVGWHVWRARWRISSLFFFIASVLLGIGLSAIQLIPSYEILKETTHPAGLPTEVASYFSFPLVHLLSFLYPFALGDPRMGTYPHFSQFDGSIFWENTGYIGLLPFAFILTALVKKILSVRFFLIALAASFLLMWGSHSPLYILYSFWPFNLFRVPSRFLWVFVFSLVTMASIGMDALFRLTQKKLFHLVTLILVCVNTITLFALWKDYHLLVPANRWLEQPALVSLIPQTGRIFTIGSEVVHNTVFLSSGWQDAKMYTALREALAPDSNVLWQRASIETNVSRQLRRTAIVDSLLASHLHVTNQEATISAVVSTILDLSSVTHLVSSVPVRQESRIQKPVIYDQKTDGVRISLFANPNALPRAYIARNTIEIHTVEEALRTLTSDQFKPGETVLVEKALSLPPSQKEKGSAEIVITDPTHLVIQSQTPQDALLVLNDTYYPGWVATVDGREVPIQPVNIRFRGILLPQGEHMVEFLYQPKSFLLGAAVSGAILIVVLGLMVFPTTSFASRTQKKVRRLGLYHRHSRGRSATHRA